jgi:hypothetical protein
MGSALTAGLIVMSAAAPVLAQQQDTDSGVAPLHRRLADLLGFEGAGRSLGVSYYTPTQDHRDIDVTAIDFSRGWKVWDVFEFQSRVGLFHATGRRTDAPYGVNPDSTATGFDMGVAARFYALDVLEVRRIRPFVEGSAQFLFTPGTHDGFPSGGSSVNGFERAGAGVLVQLTPRLAIEATYQWYSHVSDGAALSPQNPMWNGHGGTLAFRRVL